MEKQTFKRLAYGFSALVMALSAVTYIPSGNTSAMAPVCASAVSETGETDTTIVIVPNATSCTVTGTVRYNITAMELTGDLAGLTDADYTLEKSGKNVSFTLTESGINAVKTAGTLSGGITVTRGGSAVEVPFTVSFTCVDLEVEAEEALEAYVAGDDVAIHPAFNDATYTGDASNVGITVSSEDENVLIDGTTISIKTGEDGEPMVAPDRVVDVLVTATDATNDVTDTFVTKLTIKHYTPMTISDDADLAFDLNSDADTTAAFAVTAEANTVVTIAGDDDLTVVPAVDDTKTTYVFSKKDEATTVGVHEIQITQKVGDAVVSEDTRTITVYDTEDINKVINLADNADDETSLPGISWGGYDLDENSSEIVSVKAASFEEDNQLYTLTVKGVKIGTGTVTLLDNVEVPAFMKKVSYVVYNVAKEAAVEVGSNVKLDDLVDLPESYTYDNVTISDEDVAILSNGKIIGIATGNTTLTLDVVKGETQIDTATIALNVYDSEDAFELEENYYSGYNDVEDFVALLGYEAMNDASEVTYEVDNEDAIVITDEDGAVTNIFASLPGDYRVTITETLAGSDEPLNEVSTTVRVYGVAFPIVINVTENNSVHGEVTSHLVKSFEYDYNTHNVELSMSEGSYELSAPEGSAGQYEANYTVEYDLGTDEEGGEITATENGAVTLNVYEAMEVEMDDDEIDLADEDNLTASYTLSYDEDATEVTIEEVLADEDADPVLDIDKETGVISLVDAENTEPGTYYVRFIHSIEGSEEILSEPVELAVRVVDSAAVYEEAAWTDEDDAVITILDDDEMVFDKDLAFTADEGSVNIATISGEEEGLEVEVIEDEISYVRVAADNTVTPGVYTVTLSSYEADGETLINEITREVTVKATIFVEEDQTVTAGDTVKIEVPEGYSLKTRTFVDENDIYGDEETEDFFTIEEGDGFYKVTADYFTTSGNGVLSFASEDGLMTLIYRFRVIGLDAEEEVYTDYDSYEMSAGEAALVNPEGYAAIMDAVETAGYDTENLAFYEVDMNIYDENGEVIGQLNETGTPIAVVLDVESLGEAAEGYTRNYTVFFYHNGEVYEISDVTDNGDGTITFFTDKFSTYTVAYYDTKDEEKTETTSEKTPNTGASTKEASATASIASVAASVMAAVVLAGAAVIAKRK